MVVAVPDPLDLTEPVLAPLRRVIPPAGMFDLSFIVLFVVLFIVQRAVCQRLTHGRVEGPPNAAECGVYSGAAWRSPPESFETSRFVRPSVATTATR